MLSIRNYISKLLDKRKFCPGIYGSLKVALVSDNLTESSLNAECRIRALTPLNFQKTLREWQPDLLFVESAWQGNKDSWKYKIASYPERPERTNDALCAVVNEAKTLQIPTVFWNKEDDVHYERFVESAKLFDYIFTVDSDCLDKYAIDAPYAKLIQPLLFPVQPIFHNPNVAPVSRTAASSFIGSYGTHVHPRRRQWQDMLFEKFSVLGVDVYDRNSSRRAAHYRYPLLPGVDVRPRVSYPTTASLYKSYKFNLNVNTIENSPTMFSRRLIEILAVGGVAITTPSIAARRLFGDYCTIVASAQDMQAIIEWSAQEYALASERAKAGAEFVAKYHTWENRLGQLEDAGIF